MTRDGGMLPSLAHWMSARVDGAFFGLAAMGDPVTSIPEQIENLGTSGGLADSGALPMVRITLGALALPFRCLPELVRFGAIVFAVALANEIVVHYLTDAIVRYWWLIISHEAIFAPYAVVWTRIAVLGRKSVSTIPRYRYGAIEIWYLVASLLTFTILLGPVLILMGWMVGAHQSGHVAMSEGWAVIAFGILFVDVIVLVRLSFLFPAIALQRYRGFGAAWRQTHGYFERLCAIEAAVIAPYMIIQMLHQHYWYIWFFSSETWISQVLYPVVGGVTMMFCYVGIVAAPALAYKLVVHEAMESKR